MAVAPLQQRNSDQNPNWYTEARRTVTAKSGRQRLTIRLEDDGRANVLGSMQPYGRVLFDEGDYLAIAVPTAEGFDVHQVFRVDKRLSRIHMSTTFLLEYVA